ncbi:hypothetical protein FM102_08830 [Corynebacterium glutamicum]|nr:hypothetical protein FM102_08830 [Corynebacterium glutamicum]
MRAGSAILGRVKVVVMSGSLRNLLIDVSFFPFTQQVPKLVILDF